MLNTLTTSLIAALLALLIAVPAIAGPVILIDGGGGGGGGSFTFVGKANGADPDTDTTFSTTSGTISVLAGDLIIAAVQWEDNDTAELSSIDDNNNNNALAKDSEVHNSGAQMNMHLWYGIADTTNATASFDFVVGTSVPFKKAVVFVYRPSGGTVAKDITGTPAAADDTNASSSVVTGTFSTTGSSDVVCAFAGFYTASTWSNEEINNVAADRIEDPEGIAGWCDDSSAALSSVTATADYGAARYWVATAIAFEVN